MLCTAQNLVLHSNSMNGWTQNGAQDADAYSYWLNQNPGMSAPAPQMPSAKAKPQAQKPTAA